MTSTTATASQIATPKDYSLLGRNAKLAEELGLASAEWYRCPIPRKRT